MFRKNKLSHLRVSVGIQNSNNNNNYAYAGQIE
jgi:hypothetical protein